MGEWISGRRNRKSHLTKLQIDELNDNDFIWDVEEYRFKRSVDHLETYKSSYGNLLVPSKYTVSDDVIGNNGVFRLGSWINSLRTSKAKLPQYKIKILDELGFIWNVPEFEEKLLLTHVLRYKEEFGNLNIPAEYTSADGFTQA